MILRLGINAAHLATGAMVGALAVLACACLAKQGRRLRKHHASPPTPPPETTPTG